MIKEMWNDGGWFGRSLIIGLPTLLVFMLWGAILEGREWQQFSEAHHCKVVGKSTGNTVVTTGPVIGGGGTVGVGVGTSYIPGKTGWLCDDGVTYWR